MNLSLNALQVHKICKLGYNPCSNRLCTNKISPRLCTNKISPPAPKAPNPKPTSSSGSSSEINIRTPSSCESVWLRRIYPIGIAQSFGSALNGQHPLVWADEQTTSFFPAKPLGCYGDGGAVLTQDDTFNDLMRSLRFRGRSEVPFDSEHIGVKSRLDRLQAAILLPKLAIFEDEIQKRNLIAQRYEEKGHSDGLLLSVTHPFAFCLPQLSNSRK